MIWFSYHRGHLFIIDVSQSVEHDHPSAFDFLRSDLTNVEMFFARLGVPTLGLKRSFEFVTEKKEDYHQAEEEESQLIEVIQRLCDLNLIEGEKKEEEEGEANEEAIFRQAYIPRHLNEVYDVERDVEKVLKGETQELIYATLTGLVQESSLEEKADDRDGSGESRSDGREEEEEEDFEKRARRGFRFEDKDEKKQRKGMVKEEQRSKRKEKILKSVKKRQVAKTSGKR